MEKTRKTKITMLDGGTKRTLPRTLRTSIFLMTALSIGRSGGSEGGLLFPQIAEGTAHKIDQRCGHIFEYKVNVTHWEGEREVDRL